jgi:Tfp pilus assembly protein PilZ
MFTRADAEFQERRLYKRKLCGIAITIDDENRNYTGHLRNLSLGGAFIEAPVTLKAELGKELILTIPYHQREGFVVVRGVVARTRTDGIAITFIT